MGHDSPAAGAPHAVPSARKSAMASAGGADPARIPAKERHDWKTSAPACARPVCRVDHCAGQRPSRTQRATVSSACPDGS